MDIVILWLALWAAILFLSTGLGFLVRWFSSHARGVGMDLGYVFVQVFMIATTLTIGLWLLSVAAVAVKL